MILIVIKAVNSIQYAFIILRLLLYVYLLPLLLQDTSNAQTMPF